MTKLPSEDFSARCETEGADFSGEMVPFDAMIEGAMMDSLTSSASLPVSSLASMTSEAL